MLRDGRSSTGASYASVRRTFHPMTILPPAMPSLQTRSAGGSTCRPSSTHPRAISPTTRARLSRRSRLPSRPTADLLTVGIRPNGISMDSDQRRHRRQRLRRRPSSEPEELHHSGDRWRRHPASAAPPRPVPARTPQRYLDADRGAAVFGLGGDPGSAPRRHRGRIVYGRPERFCRSPSHQRRDQRPVWRMSV